MEDDFHTTSTYIFDPRPLPPITNVKNLNFWCLQQTYTTTTTQLMFHISYVEKDFSCTSEKFSLFPCMPCSRNIETTIQHYKCAIQWSLYLSKTHIQVINVTCLMEESAKQIVLSTRNMRSRSRPKQKLMQGKFFKFAVFQYLSLLFFFVFLSTIQQSFYCLQAEHRQLFLLFSFKNTHLMYFK